MSDTCSSLEAPLAMTFVKVVSDQYMNYLDEAVAEDVWVIDRSAEEDDDDAVWEIEG